MSHPTALRRCFALLGLGLLVGSLASCGQIGPLFLRMPDVEFPIQAPIIVGEPTRIFLPEGVTLPAPVSATAPLPVAATHPAPATTSAKPPSAATSKPPVATTHP
jgi:hypothetical protein